MKKLQLRNHPILSHLIEKWGEHLEHSENPQELIIQILLNTVSSQQDEIAYLKKIKAYR